MQGNDEDYRPSLVKFLALMQFSTGLARVCHRLLFDGREPQAIAHAIEEMRAEALRQVKGIVHQGFAIEDEANAGREAINMINQTFDDWLREAGDELHPVG